MMNIYNLSDGERKPISAKRELETAVSYVIMIAIYKLTIELTTVWDMNFFQTLRVCVATAINLFTIGEREDD